MRINERFEILATKEELAMLKEAIGERLGYAGLDPKTYDAHERLWIKLDDAVRVKVRP